RRLLKLRRVRRHALEHKRQKLRPPIIGQNPRSELRDGVAKLLRNRFGVLALDTGQEYRLERGLRGGGEAGPEVGVVAGELLAEEDGGHGAALWVGGVLEEVGELEGEGIGIGLLAEIEE
ncbi:hypothetical protein PanWU01x14_126480, partial [Parasponia andersonii]